MNDFLLYLEIVHEYKLSVKNTRSLIEILDLRAQNKITQDEFHAMEQEFKNYLQKVIEQEGAQSVLSFDEFITLLKPQMNLKAMHKLLVDELLSNIPQQLQTLYFQFINSINQYFVSTDEVQLILLTVLEQNEIKSFSELIELATQTINELLSVRGLIPQSKFILYLTQFDLDEESLKSNILRLQEMHVQTFNQILADKINRADVKNYCLYNPELYAIRFGSNINMQVINSLSQHIVKQFKQKNINLNLQDIQQQFTEIFVEYEQGIQRILNNGITINDSQVSFSYQPQQKQIISQNRGTFPGFDIDQLIIAADWEEVDIHAPIDISNSPEVQKLMNTFPNSVFNAELVSQSVNKSNDDDYDQMNDFLKANNIGNKSQNILTQQSFLLTSQKFNSKLIGQQDDGVMKQLKKMLNNLK